MADNWIKVSERTPDDNMEYICKLSDGTEENLWHDSERSFFYRRIPTLISDEYPAGVKPDPVPDVTHWKKLPPGSREWN
jgi:hypothetical protein